MEKKYLIAKQAYDNSYAKYSHFQVGAVVVLKDKTMIMGTNIENASYGLTICAERSALFSTYSQGYRKDDIDELVIMTSTKIPTSPCGACRQVISELMNLDAKVTLVNLDYQTIELKVSDLLPYLFSEANLNE